MEILVRNEYEGRTLSVGDPIEDYNYNLNKSLCFIMLIILSIVLKIISISFLKLNSKR